MLDYKRFKKDIFLINQENFESYCLAVYEYQYSYNPVYREYSDYLNRTPDSVNTIHDIPFLPIDLFKKHIIQTETWEPQKVFQSSGTTGQVRSKHYVRDEKFYHQVAKSHFESLYGSLENLQVLALLPSYQEQENSSLINMVDSFMGLSLPGSSYFLNNQEALMETLVSTERHKILFGVSFALLDLAEKTSLDVRNLTIIETGGMKGRREEIIREELHQKIKNGLGDYPIHSEYGMTELTSQGYMINEYFTFPKWAKVLIRDVNDPFTYKNDGNSGGLNIIDLANIATCSFIETKDLGKIDSQKGFQVLGRFDNSDIRGCNLLL
ncbi:MAG: acyl transferase [Cyclobacteriaceae bacterium]